MMNSLTVDWTTVSSLATAAGTLILSVATFAAVRSSNRSARIAEVALQEQRRPILAPSRLEDPKQKIMFLEGNWFSAEGGRAAVEHIDGSVFLAISLRNVGSGIAVCQGWTVRPGDNLSRLPLTHAPLEDFRLQSRDLYVAGGDIGMWQGALRNPDDAVRAQVVDGIEQRQRITVELLYSDQVGRQRTISRFNLVNAGDAWLVNLNRHWYLDWDGPRPDDQANAAAQLIFHEHEVAEERRAAAQGVDAEADPGDGAEAGTAPADALEAEPMER
jgi:hypothetical protein